MLRPPQRAVSAAYVNILVAEVCKAALSNLRQISLTLYRINFFREVSQDGGSVPRARADLEYAIVGLEL